MSPLEYIKEGILNGNWKTVCEGYERLTGDTVSLPQTSVGGTTAEKALKQISDIISETQIIQTEQAEKPTKKKPGRPKGSKKKNAKKKTTVDMNGEDSSIILNDANKTVVQKEVGNTQLITNDPDLDEVKANKIRAAKSSTNKTRFMRKASTTYGVECNECNNTFQSTRPGGEMGQKCPKCLRDLKGRFA